MHNQWLLPRRSWVPVSRRMYGYHLAITELLSSMQRLYAICPTPRKSFTPYKDMADALTAATNSFSNVYSCPVKNGSFALSWCCGATEGSQQARDGCCNGPLFTPDFGFAIAEIGVLETECNTTDTSSSSELTASSSSNSAAPSRSLATQWTSSNVALASTADRSPNPTPSSKETAAIATGVGLAVEPSSKPVAPSEKGVAIGAGVGVPVGVLLLSGLVLLFLRERRQRVQAQKVANDAHTIAAERGTTGVQGYELYGQSLPQELPHAQVGPEELSSW